MLVAPLSCRGSDSLAETTTVCSNLIGIDYSGSGIYNPSLPPVLLAGLGAAVTAGTLSRIALLRSLKKIAKRTGRTAHDDAQHRD